MISAMQTFPISVAAGTSMQILWSTNINNTASGYVTTVSNWTYPLRRFTITPNITGELSNAETLFNFFNARKGGFETFLFAPIFDPTQGNVPGVPLVRIAGNTYSTLRSPFRDVLTTLQGVSSSGVPIGPTNYTFDVDGQTITFTTDRSTEILTCSGVYRIKVRFESDNLTVNDPVTFGVSQYTLIEVR